jgi:hypothetical protein
MNPTPAPQTGEASDYYFRYINLVPPGNICAILDRQLSTVLEMLEGIPDDRVDHRYASGKWSVREVLSHVNDTERVFAFRALWFARGFRTPLPSFDEQVAVSEAAAGPRPWMSHVEEFGAIRTSTLHLFRHLSPEAWGRSGVASDRTFTVRALAYIVAGHVTHHMSVLRERYL